MIWILYVLDLLDWSKSAGKISNSTLSKEISNENFPYSWKYYFLSISTKILKSKVHNKTLAGSAYALYGSTMSPVFLQAGGAATIQQQQ